MHRKLLPVLAKSLLQNSRLVVPVNCMEIGGRCGVLSANIPAASAGFGFSRRAFSVSSLRFELMEFFDDKKNWAEAQVRSGRPWKVEELRIKSNTDLHKLWYVLLKERNMLMTMEHECKRAFEVFPGPERIDKVEESMKNLEEVVRERNRAYYLLETGVTGERPGEEVENFLGLPEYQQFEEHDLPKELNKAYLKAKSEEPQVDQDEKRWFLHRWRGKQRNEVRKDIRRQQWYVVKILQRFPNVDVEALKEKYPDVNVDRYVEKFLKEKHQGNLRSKEYRGYGYYT